ncbi:hypothetical protein NQ176_g5001 [Zarea fungicola]|uniref:Uncharacterized protein n=1 Tax=Zarea fungicola TaxID=93591 RepID=A0ACC1ND55_9HYPO|nr:hypothetical protein NQ176_g5001 [Lecanicillium fungicola]
MGSSPTDAFIETEGAKIHYWYQGSGPLLLFIPGASGCGSQFNNIMAILSSSYTCATLDRRGKSDDANECGSELFSPPQQARDIVAVINAMGFQKAIVVGSSLGGVLGFQLALDHPDVIDHLICHEAPIVMILPDASAWVDKGLSLQKTYREDGLGAALGAFMSLFKGYDDPSIPQAPPPSLHNIAHFFEYEFLIASVYAPDWRRIRKNNVSIAVLQGKRSGDAYYARSTVEQADILGCLRVEVPGHHTGFVVEAVDFAVALEQVIAKLEDAKQSTMSARA